MKTKTVFFTPEDLKLPENRANGIRTPGWNFIQEWTDSNGNTRRRVEPVVVNAGVVETSVDSKPVEEIKQEPAVVNSDVVETRVEEIKQDVVIKTKAKSK